MVPVSGSHGQKGDGEERETFKEPKTDAGGSKKSARGFLAVVKNDEGELKLRQGLSWADVKDGYPGDAMTVIFKDGKLSDKPDLNAMREVCRNNAEKLASKI